MDIISMSRIAGTDSLGGYSIQVTNGISSVEVSFEQWPTLEQVLAAADLAFNPPVTHQDTAPAQLTPELISQALATVFAGFDATNPVDLQRGIAMIQAAKQQAGVE
jgi:hypothetical protein